MRLVPKMKILHRTIFRPEIFPQVKTSLRSQVSASTNMRGPRRCLFSCISNHLQRKSLSTRKVITIFSLLGKNNIVVLMWFVLRQGMEKATLTRNRTKTLSSHGDISVEPHCCQSVFTQIHGCQSTIITVVLAVYLVISQTIRISNWADRGALHVLILRLVFNPWMYAS